MASYSRTIRIILTTALILLIGLLVLQALGYGVGFAIGPESGVREFGYEEPTAMDDLTVALVGLVGVGMLGIAAGATARARISRARYSRSATVGSIRTARCAGMRLALSPAVTSTTAATPNAVRSNVLTP